jgi:hypothetical protein
MGTRVRFRREKLALVTDTLSSPDIRRLLDALASARGRTELAAFGYDVRETGKRVAFPA